MEMLEKEQGRGSLRHNRLYIDYFLERTFVGVKRTAEEKVLSR